VTVAGYREFQTGEVLTAANVDDFLAKQAVMKFADSAARDTALGTAVAGGNALREGMVAWLDSDDELQAYDGTAWASVGGSAGIGSNVVRATRTLSFTTTSVAYVDVTDLSVTITPTTDTSLVLLVASFRIRFNRSPSGTNIAHFQITDASNAVISGGGEHIIEIPNSPTSSYRFPVTFFAYDSPASASAQTYKLRIKSSADTDGGMEVEGDDSTAQLFAIEVAP